MNRKHNPTLSLVALLLAAIILVLTCTGCGVPTAAAENETKPAPWFVCETADNFLGLGILYIVTDTETGVQYLAWWKSNGAAMTVLLPGEGKE